MAREVSAQRGQTSAGLGGEALGATLLAVLLALFVGGLLARFAGRGAMQKINGYHAPAFGLRADRDGGRELQEALRADEVGLELRAERVAAPAYAVNLGSAARKQGVVDRDTDGFGIGDKLGDLLAYAGEQGRGGDAMLRGQAVGGRPILKLLPAGG